MAYSELDICNLALSKLGAAQIDSLTSTDTVPVLCATMYAPARDFALRSHPWNCAVGKADLGSANVAPVECYFDDAVYNQGTYALRAIVKTAATAYNFLRHSYADDLDISGLDSIMIDLRSTFVGTTAVYFKFHSKLSGDWALHTETISVENTWETKKFDISSIVKNLKEDVDKLEITFEDKDSDYMVYIDNMYAAVSPISQWKMNDDAATKVVIDSVGSNAGTSSNNTDTMSVAGKINNALEFNGTDESITISDAVIPTSGNFSISTWVYCAGELAGDTDKYGTVLGSATYVTDVKGLVLRVDSANGLVATYGNGTNSLSLKIIDDINTTNKEKWYHIVLTYNSTTTTLKHYANGILTGSSSSIEYADAGSGQFVIGHSPLNATESYWYGKIDNTRIYDFALNESDARALYNSGNGTEVENSVLNSTSLELDSMEYASNTDAQSAYINDFSLLMFGWDYMFDLPDGTEAYEYCLRVLQVNEDRNKFRVEGRKLLTDAETVQIEYIERISDPTKFDSMLYNQIATKLAADLAVAITGFRTRADAMLTAYNFFLKSAKLVDAGENTPKKLKGEGSWLTSRRQTRY